MARPTILNNVLSNEDYDAMTAELKRLEDLPGVMAKAEKCGVDCTEYRKMADDAKARIELLLKTWFPKGRLK